MKAVFLSFLGGSINRSQIVKFRNEEDFSTRVFEEIEKFEDEEPSDYVAVLDEYEVEDLFRKLKKPVK